MSWADFMAIPFVGVAINFGLFLAFCVVMVWMLTVFRWLIGDRD